MRYDAAAPAGVMEYLFIKLMVWAKDQGYKWFNIGMAPLAGLQNRSLAPLWNRIGKLVYSYGENFYNFQGLRAYKEKFKPRWKPKYIVSPAGLALPAILTDIASITSGGIKGLVSK
jgi:phosphatidylglycerol lysyltransferase